MKYSRQRELILETVRRSDDHPTADTIYARVRAQDPKVSLGTVYRNLNLLCENGQLLKVPIPGSSDRFDHTLGDHAHAYCTQCGSACGGNAEQGKPEGGIAVVAGFRRVLAEQNIAYVVREVHRTAPHAITAERPRDGTSR